jgi:hypothetical protein
MAGKNVVNQLQLGDSVTATQNFVLQTNVDGTAKLARGNAGAVTQDILTVGADGKVVFPQTAAGTFTAGTPCIYGPSIAASVKTTAAHNLGGIPAFTVAYAECMIAEQGYSVGDRVAQNRGAEVNGFDVVYDATSVVILTSNNVALTILNKTTPGARAGATAANWRLVVVPYRLN